MFAYVGCFTTAHRHANGKGISQYSVDPQSGEWTLADVHEALPNPGFLALDSRRRFLYVAHGDGDAVSAYAIEATTGRLRPLGTQPTGGDNSPHLVVSPDDRYVVVANGPGIAVFPVGSDGALQPASDIMVPAGERGPYRREQPAAHPHQVLFDPDGRFLVVPDKGLDRLHVYRLDAASGKLVANDPPGISTRYGAVPRHAAFNPDGTRLYVVNELGSTVVAHHWDGERGELKPFQVLPCTPDTHTGNNSGAEICVAPSGHFVYVSNRGHDSIGVFAVDAISGRLHPVDWQPTGGKRPRFFALSPAGDMLYAANQNSDSIVEFSVNTDDGTLTPTGQIVATGAPSCIVFAYH